MTNDNAENFKLMETPIDRISKENWQVVVPHRADVLLETVTVFKDHIVIEKYIRRVYRHEIGSDSHELVYEEQDETFNVCVSKALSERFLYIAVVIKIITDWKFTVT